MLSEIWNFETITDFCKKLLDTTTDIVLAAVIAKQFGWCDLLEKSYATLSKREESISNVEALRMGPEVTAEVARLREAHLKATPPLTFRDMKAQRAKQFSRPEMRI